MKEVVASFLEGMYYAGALPSRAESYQIARYLKSRKMVSGTMLEVETVVIEAMKALHQRTEPHAD